jgi:hypothetical protein
MRATIATARDNQQRRAIAFAAVLLVAALGGARLAPAAPGGAAAQPRTPSNPCEGREARHLRCPNLRIGRPSEMYVSSNAGGTILRATSDVKSRGLGPMELHGIRNGNRSMRVNQRIYEKGGGHITLPTRATLHFTDVGSYWGGSYWKVHQLASFELWSVGRHHKLLRLVRTGPKLNYCLRDLERTRPGRRSPSSRHYPGCNQNPYQDRVILGTSVGWSDIYPSEYDKQWIRIGGLRGCYAFVLTVDPKHHLYESNERDNSAHRLVRLPYPGHPGC